MSIVDRRLELQTIFETLLGTRDVYFQPPVNVVLKYPCIVFKRDKVDSKFANNKAYALKVRYSVTIIDKNPDSPFVEKLLMLPFSSFDRHFTSDNLNHDVFNIYY